MVIAPFMSSAVDVRISPLGTACSYYSYFAQAITARRSGNMR